MTTAASPDKPTVTKGGATKAASFKINESGRSVLVRVIGPLDLEHAPELLDRISPLCVSGRRVVLDLLQADYVDSSGVRTILQMQALLGTVRGELRLVIQAGSRVERVFSLLRLMDQLEIYRTVSAAWEGQASVS